MAISNADKETQDGNFYRAIQTLKEALLISEKIDDKKTQGIILSKIAKLKYNVEESKDAKYSIIKAIAIQSSIDDKLNLAISRYTYGLIYLGQKDYSNALDYFNSARTIFEEEGLNELISEVTLSEAKAHIGLGNLSQANALVENTIIMSKKYGFDSLLGTAMIKSGLIAFKQNKFQSALSQTTEGSEIAKTNGDLEVLNESYRLLSDIYSKLNNYEYANINLRLYIDLNDSILKSKSEILSAEKRAQFIIDDKDAVIKSQQDEISAKDEATNLSKLTTILSIGLITILSLLTLSLYKNNNIRSKTNNMLFKKNTELITEKERAEIAAKAKMNFCLRSPMN